MSVALRILARAQAQEDARRCGCEDDVLCRCACDSYDCWCVDSDGCWHDEEEV